MADPNVGNIEVTVNANTGKLEAQVVRGAKRAGEAGAKVLDDNLGDISGHEALARMNVLKRRLERVLAGIEAEPTLHDTTLRAQIKLLQASLNALALELPINADPDYAEFAASVEAINSILGDIRVGVEPVLDRAELAAVVAVLQETLGAISTKVNTDVNDASLAASLAKVEAAFGRTKIEVGVEVSRTFLDRAAQQMRFAFGGAGGDSGEDAATEFADHFIGGLSRESKLIVSAVVALGDVIAVGLVGALSAATAVISSAFSALAGGAGALVPIFAGLVGTISAVVVGAQGMGDAFKAINDELKAAAVEGRAFNIEAEKIVEAMTGMSGPARSFALALAEVLPQWQRMQGLVSAELFRGLDDALRDLATQALPEVSEALQTMARSANTFFLDMAAAAGEVDFSGLADAFVPVVGHMQRAAVDLFRALEPLLLALTPAARELAESFENGARSLTEMIEAGAASGELSKFFVEGVQSLRLWGDLLVAVGDALFTIFQAGKAQGDSFVQQLTDIVNKFDEWLESAQGQNALLDFFELGREVMSALVPILVGLKDAFAEMLTAESVDRFTQLAQTIGDALPALGAMLEQFGRFEVIGVVIDTVRVALEAFSAVLEALPDFLVTGIGQVIGMTIAIKGIIGVGVGAAQAVKALGDAIGLLTKQFIGFAVANPILFGVAAAITAISVAFVANSQAAKKAREEVDEYAGAIGETIDETNKLRLDKFWENVADEQDKTLDSIDALNLGIGEFAATIIADGSKVNRAAADMLAPLLDAGDPLNDLLRTGEVTLREIEQEFKKFQGGPASQVGGVFEGLGDALDAAGIDAATATEIFDLLADEQEEIAKGAEQAARDARIQADSYDALASAATDAAGGLGPMADASVRAREAQESEAVAAQELTARLGPLVDASLTAREAMTAEAVAAQEVADRLATQTDVWRRVEGAMIGVTDPLGDAELGFLALKDAASDAEDAATELRETLDLFVDPATKAQRAARNHAKALTDLAVALRGGSEAEQLRNEATEKTIELEEERAKGNQERVDELQKEIDLANFYAGVLEGQAKALDLTTEAGQEAAAAVDAQVQAILDQAEAFTLQGKSAAESASAMVGWVNEAVNAGVQAGLTDEQTRALLATYGLTPDAIATTFLQTGMTDAQKQAAQYDEDLNGIPDVIDTLIQQPGMSQAMIDALLYDADLDGIPDVVDTQILQTGMPAAQTAAETYDSTVTGLPETWDTLFTAPGLDDVISRTDTLNDKVTVLDGRTVTINFDVGRFADVQAMFRQAGGEAGGVVPRGTWAWGGEGSGAELFHTPSGAFGVVSRATPFPGGTELTPIPGSSTAAINSLIEELRGGALGGPHTVINQYFTLTSADPAAVSVQTMNRAAALALV